MKDRCEAARLEENTILGFFLEALQERVLREVLMQDPTTVQQAMDASLMVERLDQRVNKVRYGEVSMPHYLPVSTKVNLPSEVFLSPYASATLYAVKTPTVSSEYTMPLITPMLPSSVPSRSFEAIFKIEDVDVESKFTNMRQELLDTMKEVMHQQFATMSEQMSCMMQDKLQYRPPSQESGHVQTGYWCTGCGQHGHTVAYCSSRRANTPPRPRPYGGNFNNAGPSRRWEPNNRGHENQEVGPKCSNCNGLHPTDQCN